MGNACVQWGVRGWLVACGGKSQVKVTQKKETTKKDKSGKFVGRKKKSKNLHQRSLGESTLDPNQEGSEGLPFNQEYLRKGPT